MELNELNGLNELNELNQVGYEEKSFFQRLMDSDSFFNMYIFGPVATFFTAHFANMPAMDIALLHMVSTGTYEGILTHAPEWLQNIGGNRFVRDVIARPLITALGAAYARGELDLRYMGQVYLVTLLAIHSPVILKGIYHLLENIISRYKD